MSCLKDSWTLGSGSQDSGPLQWLGEPAVAANDHVGTINLKGDSAEAWGDNPSHLLEHPSGGRMQPDCSPAKVSQVTGTMLLLAKLDKARLRQHTERLYASKSYFAFEMRNATNP